MIWNSVALMTAIDLLIVIAVAYSFRAFLVHRRALAAANAHIGLMVIGVGLLLMAGFYISDLVAMHVLPLFVATSVAMDVMADLHLNYRWIVTLVGVGPVALGAVAVTRQLIVSIKRSNRSEERFNALFESETIGVSITSADGSYIATNPAYQHMLRYSAEELRGMRWQDVSLAEDIEHALSETRHMRSGEDSGVILRNAL